MIYAALESNCVPIRRTGGGVGRGSRREWLRYLAMVTGDGEELQDTLKHRGKPSWSEGTVDAVPYTNRSGLIAGVMVT